MLSIWIIACAIGPVLIIWHTLISLKSFTFLLASSIVKSLYETRSCEHMGWSWYWYVCIPNCGLRVSSPVSVFDIQGADLCIPCKPVHQGSSLPQMFVSSTCSMTCGCQLTMTVGSCLWLWNFLQFSLLLRLLVCCSSEAAWLCLCRVWGQEGCLGCCSSSWWYVSFYTCFVIPPWSTKNVLLIELHLNANVQELEKSNLLCVVCLCCRLISDNLRSMTASTDSPLMPDQMQLGFSS